jgi:hypothetical protein
VNGFTVTPSVKDLVVWVLYRGGIFKAKKITLAGHPPATANTFEKKEVDRS